MEKNKGLWGEHVAAAYLRRRFYRIVDMRYRTRFGEIDIIAKRGRYLVFVEVKLRKTDRFAEAMEYVDRRKQERILSSASLYLAKYPTRLQPRFDVIEVYAPEGSHTKRPRINHLEDAFS